jgi:hypothetical protein
MSIESRKLKVGDYALTDYNTRKDIKGSLTMVQITTIQHGKSQSGIMFQVKPKLKHQREDSWYDADWFEVMPKNI